MRNLVCVTAWCLFGVATMAGCSGSISVPAARPTSTATSPGASPTPAASASPGLLYVGTSTGTIAVFSTAASGNVAPLRAFAGNAPVGTGASGVWTVQAAYGFIENLGGTAPPLTNAGGTHYSTLGAVLDTFLLPPVSERFGPPDSVGAVTGATDAAGNFYLADGIRVTYTDLMTEPPYDCEFPQPQIDEYAAGSTGTPHPIRTIVLPFDCQVWSLTVDRAGHLWVAGGYGSSDSSIVEYATNATGAATPIRTIDLGTVVFYPTNGLGEMEDGGPSIAVDSAGTLYATTPSEYGASSLVRYLPGSNAPETFLNHDYAEAVAIDAHDDVFVTVPVTPYVQGVYEYKFPSTTPIHAIAGLKTGLGGVTTGLAVTR